LSSVQRYDPTADNWQEVASLTMRRGNFGAAAFAEGRRIMVVGGVDVINGERPKLSTSEVYDVETDEWQLLDERLPMPRASLACAPAGPETVLAVGGIVPADGGVVPTAAVHAIRVEVSEDTRYVQHEQPSTRPATTGPSRILSRA
jgi:N-acetylneuraminic acid mutarotase